MSLYDGIQKYSTKEITEITNSADFYATVEAKLPKAELKSSVASDLLW